MDLTYSASLIGGEKFTYSYFIEQSLLTSSCGHSDCIQGYCKAKDINQASNAIWNPEAAADCCNRQVVKVNSGATSKRLLGNFNVRGRDVKVSEPDRYVSMADLQSVFFQNKRNSS